METLKRAIVQVEDRRFYRHFGIDIIATVRALAVNLIERRYAQGGSTITQQLARTLYLHNRKTLWRKIKEAFVALWLEHKFTKDQILDLYVSKVYMGQRKDGSTIVGFDEASVHHFGVPVKYALLSQKAALVAMLKGPNVYTPNSLRGRARAMIVLGTMLEAGIHEQPK